MSELSFLLADYQFCYCLPRTLNITPIRQLLYFTFILLSVHMASDTLAARQPSLPPTANSPLTSRHASVEPISKALNSDSDAAAARARSVSVEPEASTTPKATTPAPQSSGETRAESVEPSSSSEVSL